MIGAEVDRSPGRTEWGGCRHRSCSPCTGPRPAPLTVYNVTYKAPRPIPLARCTYCAAHVP